MCGVWFRVCLVTFKHRCISGRGTEPYSTALSALVQSVVLHTKPFFVVAKEDAGQRSTFNRNAQKRYTFLNNRKVAVDVQTGVQLVSIQYQEFTLKPSYVEIS